MIRPDAHIRALAAEVKAAYHDAGVHLATFEAMRPGRRMRVPFASPTWAEWLSTPSGVAHTAACAAFEAAADRLIGARPETLFGLALKLHVLTLADLSQEDMDRLAEERREIIAAEGGDA